MLLGWDGGVFGGEVVFESLLDEEISVFEHSEELREGNGGVS